MTPPRPHRGNRRCSVRRVDPPRTQTSTWNDPARDACVPGLVTAWWRRAVSEGASRRVPLGPLEGLRHADERDREDPDPVRVRQATRERDLALQPPLQLGVGPCRAISRKITVQCRITKRSPRPITSISEYSSTLAENHWAVNG
jgi:hypothetical protein